MMLKKNPEDLSKPKTLKVTLPTRMHLQLHQLKILSGTNISDMVETALEDYLTELKNSQGSAAQTAAEA